MTTAYTAVVWRNALKIQNTGNASIIRGYEYRQIIFFSAVKTMSKLGILSSLRNHDRFCNDNISNIQDDPRKVVNIRNPHV